jgi:large subunit ribosomal protein L24
MAKVKIKKNDQVQILAGKDRGARGKVLRVNPEKGTVVVERVNLIKRHTRQNPQKQIKGGILEREAPIHISNVMVVDPNSGKPTRIGRKRLEDGSGVRVAKKSGTTLS